jgi:hypothetical protein
MKRFVVKLTLLACIIPVCARGEIKRIVEADKAITVDSVVFLANITEIPEKESYELNVVLPPYDRAMEKNSGRDANLWFTVSKNRTKPLFVHLNKPITTLLTGGLLNDDAKYVLPLQLNPGDVIELKKSCAHPKRVEVIRNGRADENLLSSFTEVYEKIHSTAKQNDSTLKDYTVAILQLYKTYKDKPGFSSIDKGVWNGMLQSILLERCLERDQQKGITILDPDTISTLRNVVNRLAIEEGIESNAVFLNVLRNTFGSIERAMAPKSQEWSFASFVDMLRAVCPDVDKKGINTFGQYLLIYALPDLCLHEDDVVEAHKKYSGLFTENDTKERWNTVASNLQTGKEGTTYATLLKLPTIASIRKRHATPYTTIFFFPANWQSGVRLTSLRNVITDFKNNASISLVYGCVSDKGETDKTVLELKAKCKGNDFVIFSPEEYEKICRIAGENKRIPAITLDKKGRVLTRGIDDRYGEFHFRKDLNSLLNK